MKGRFPIVPINDDLLRLDLDNINSFGKGEIAQYLNEVLEYYGPPCEFCRHFDCVCELGLRLLKYDLRIGPYAEWHIRKFCKNHGGRDNTEEQNSDLARVTRNQLNCDAQTYGTGS